MAAGGNCSESNCTSSLSGLVNCNLTEGYSFLLQTVLGVLAFSTLLLKRLREPKAERRPFWIWVADTAKQALGMLEIHFVNIAISAQFQEKECTSYLVSFLLDSTVGLLIIYVLLKAIAWVVAKRQITPLVSGEYGDPFKFHYWLAQCGVYLAVMLIEKVIVGPLVFFDFWKKVEGFFPQNKFIKIAIVIIIVPLVVNVLMFWIVDSILMHKRKKDGASSSPGIHYHRSSARYNRLRYNVESCSDSDSSEEGEVALYKKGGHSRGHRQLASRAPIRTQPLADSSAMAGERDAETRLDSTEL